jgi:hypothetical protein
MKKYLLGRTFTCISVLIFTLFNAVPTKAQTDILDLYRGATENCQTALGTEISIAVNIDGCGPDTTVIIKNLSGYRSFVDNSPTHNNQYNFSAPLLSACGSSGLTGQFSISFKSGVSDIGVKKLSFVLCSHSTAAITGVQFFNISGTLTADMPVSESCGKRYSCEDNTTGITSVVITCNNDASVNEGTLFELNSLFIPPPCSLPATPVASAGSAAACNQITANWGASSGATGYFLDVSTVNSFGSFVSGYNGLDVLNVTTYNITGLTPGTTYYYRVRAYNTCGCGISINSGTITYATLPAAPTAPVATAGTGAACTQITANWNASVNATKYYLDVSPVIGFSSFVGIYNNLDVGNVLTLNVTGLTAGTSYYYRIRAYNSCGTSVSSNIITYATLPATPAAPAATAGTGAACTQITANWDASANATKYFLDVSSVIGFSSFVGIYNNLDVGNVLTLNVTGLTAGTTYYYRVRANNSCGTSANSITITYATSPATPAISGAITGSPTQCALSTGKIYSITAVSSATTYAWTVPAGWIITGVTGTNSITVTTGAAGQNGNITVTAGNSCGTSAERTLAVTVIPAPVVAIGSYGPYCINSVAVTLIGTPTDANGIWSGDGITDNHNGTAIFNPSTALAGDHQITYSYTDANSCSASANTTITVLSDCPEVVCVMDISGSMTRDFYGTYGMPQNQWRISYAKTALKAFAEVLYSNFDGGTSYGLASFHSTSGGLCEASEDYPMSILYESNYIPVILPVIDALNAAGGTPLLAGLERAKNMFLTSDLNLKKVIILLSDGAHNCPYLTDLLTNPVYTGLMDQIKLKNIKVYTIAFGQSGEVDPVLLSDIASKTTGKFYDVTNPSDPNIKVVPNSATTSPANIWDAGNALHMVYSQILSSLDLSYSADPMGVINKGTTAQFDVPVSGLENKITFFISWATPQTDYLPVKIITSDGVELPPSHSGIKYIKRDNYTVITISENLLRQPGVTGANPWKLVLDASNVTNEQEKFQYMVFSQSRKLRFHTWFDKNWYYTGDKMKIYLEVLKEDKRVTNLNKLRITGSMPKEGIGNLLAGKKVTQQQLDELKREELRKITNLTLEQATNLKLDLSAKQKLQKENLSSQLDIMTSLWLKTRIINSGGENIFNDRVRINGIEFYDNGSHGDSLAGDGLYIAVVNRITREGSYIFNISAVDTSNGNINLENQLQKYINVKIRPRRFIKEVTLTDTVIKGTKIYSLKLNLRDKYGNRPSPNSMGYIRLSVDKGELIGQIQSNPDGSFTQKLSLPEGVKPSDVKITMKVYDQVGVQRLKPLLPKWIYLSVAGIIVITLGILKRKK